MTRSRDVAKACGFRFAKDLSTALKAVLHAHPAGTVFAPNSREHDLLSRYYACHPSALPFDPPMAFGVVDNGDQFMGGYAPGFVARFCLDGGEHRLTIHFEKWGKPDVAKAARNAVGERHGSGPDGYHLDHQPPWPFARIVHEWQIALGRPPKYDRTRIGQWFDPADKLDFLRFHDERAVLVPIPADENMRAGSRGWRKPSKAADGA